MSKLLGVVGSIVGSHVGRYAAHPAGTMTAFAASVIGTGAGLWFGRRAAERLIG